MLEIIVLLTFQVAFLIALMTVNESIRKFFGNVFYGLVHCDMSDVEWRTKWSGGELGFLLSTV